MNNSAIKSIDKKKYDTLGLSRFSRIFSQKLVALAIAALAAWSITTVVFNLDKTEYEARVSRQEVALKRALFDSLERLDAEAERLMNSRLLLEGFYTGTSLLDDASLNRLMHEQYTRTRFIKGYAVFNDDYKQQAIWSMPSFDLGAYGLENWLRKTTNKGSDRTSIKLVADTAFLLSHYTLRSGVGTYTVMAVGLTQLLETISNKLNSYDYQVFLETPDLFLSQTGPIERPEIGYSISAASTKFPPSWRLHATPIFSPLSSELPEYLLWKSIIIFLLVVGFVYFFLRLPRLLHDGILQAHKTILERERWFSHSLDALPDAFAVFNESGEIIIHNEAFAALFTHAFEYISNGKSLDFILTQARQTGFITYLKEHRENSDLHTRIIDIGLNDGRWLTVLRQNMDGGAFVCYFHDISDWHNRETELAMLSRQAESEASSKSKLIIQFNEQMKTPLLMLSELVSKLKNFASNTEMRLCLNQLDEVDSQIRCVAEQLVSLTKKQYSSSLSLKASDIDINNVIDRGIDILSTRAQGSNIELGAKTPADGMIYTDEKLLSQLHLFMLTNIIESLQSGRVVTEVRFRRNEKRFVMDLIYKVYGSNHNCEFQENIKFLANSKDGFLVDETHGIELKYLSMLLSSLNVTQIITREKENATQIMVTLPVSRPYSGQASLASRRIAAEISATPNENSKEHISSILLVDDDPINEAITRNMLESEGYQIQCATSAVEAMLKASQTEFDVILMDIMLPDISGVQLMRKIRRNNINQHTKVIAYTANEDTDQQYQKLGFDDYLSKPVEKARLKEIIKSAGN